jgi:hypothetical protein
MVQKRYEFAIDKIDNNKTIARLEEIYYTILEKMKYRM